MQAECQHRHGNSAKCPKVTFPAPLCSFACGCLIACRHLYAVVELWPSKGILLCVCVSERACLVWSHGPQACETARLLSTDSDYMSCWERLRCPYKLTVRPQYPPVIRQLQLQKQRQCTHSVLQLFTDIHGHSIIIKITMD